jgi:Endonuclease/Exonuclease/phosphatase family
MPSTAWWNLENLRRGELAPPDRESAARDRRRRGWLDARSPRSKGFQLASVIAQMNDGAGPDLLGVCDVENRFVLDLLVDTLATPLPGRSYAVVHADTDDARGIDVAFRPRPVSRSRPTRCSSTWSCAATPPASSSR